MNERIAQLVYRNYRAIKHGFFFGRTKTFKLPVEIRFNKRKLPICLPEDATKLFMEVFLGDEYWLRYVPSSEIKNIVDIGANVGTFGITARTFFPYAEITCYEPNCGLREYLDENGDNFELNIEYSAVGPQEGVGYLENTHTFGSVANFVEDTKGNIPIKAIGSIVEDYPNGIDLLKLDCEGYEHELFKVQDIWHNVKYITMEYHASELRSVVQTLNEIGFDPIKTFKGPFWIGNILAKRINP